MKPVKYLLDTNICISILRNQFNIDKIIRKIGIENCAISEITYAELLYGAYCSSRPEENIKNTITFCDSFHIFKISDILNEFSYQKSLLRKKGLLIDDFDLLIGSTAVYYDLILVTDNVRHFSRMPVSLENWIER